MAGSGKSYCAKQIIEDYIAEHPDGEVYLISKLSKDNTLDSIKPPPVRINIDKLVENPPKDLSKFCDTLFVFDDFEGYEPKQLKVVEQLIKDIAIEGRHHRISMIYITHYLTNYAKSRLILKEAHFFVIFPENEGEYAYLTFMKNHMGFSEDESLSLRERAGKYWVCLHRHAPRFVLTESEAWLIKHSKTKH